VKSIRVLISLEIIYCTKAPSQNVMKIQLQLLC